MVRGKCKDHGIFCIFQKSNFQPRRCVEFSKGVKQYEIFRNINAKIESYVVVGKINRGGQADGRERYCCNILPNTFNNQYHLKELWWWDSG